MTIERWRPRPALALVLLNVRDHVDLDSINPEMLTVVNTTIQPRHASLWLRPRSGS